MSANVNKTVERAWARLVKAERLAMTMVEKALKKAGLPDLAWYDALLELERAGDEGLRPFELQHEMLLEQYNLSRLIGRMAERGLVARRRCDADGRGQVLVVTDEGRKRRREMWTVYEAAIETVMGQTLSPADSAALDTLLGRLIERLQDR